MSLKQAVKLPLQWAGAIGGRHRWPVGQQGSLLVLTYHRVLPDDHTDRGTEQPGMIVSPQTLAMHIEVLRNHFAFVHLDDWLERAARGDVDRHRCCAVTFDDGWRDNFDHAFPVLQGKGVPATFFLVTGRVGSVYEFWPNRLQRFARSAHQDDFRRLLDRLETAGVRNVVPRQDTLSVDRLIGACKSLPDATLHELLDDVTAPAAGTRDLMDWDEVATMAESGLARFGSHTRNHTRLFDGLEKDSLADEITASKRDLESRLDAPCELFCYPNGDCSTEARQLVRDTYTAAVSTESGWNNSRTDRTWLRRIGLHEDISDTPTKFLSRIGGFV